MDLFIDVLLDVILDTLKIWPLLFLTYLLMEYIEHKAGERMTNTIRRSSKTGPLWGSLVGLVPQCGLAGAAAGFYSGRIITAGTLFAVFLATSDEMLPILISATVPLNTILIILCIKLAIAIGIGYLIDAFWKRQPEENHHFCTICQDEHCGCEKSIVHGAFHHSLHICAFLFALSLLLGLIIAFVGLEELHGSFLTKPFLSVLISALLGLIPNCASSVIITQLYVDELFHAGALMSGLLVNAGVGLLVLYRVNRDWRENVKITALLFVIGIITGVLLECFHVTF